MKTNIKSSLVLASLPIACMLVLAACNDNNDPPTAAETTAQLQTKIKNIVVIYAENRRSRRCS